MTDSQTSTDEEYGAFTTGGGDTIVYDPTNSAAWIQSDYAIEIGRDNASA
jgi:hypothetical protein